MRSIISRLYWCLVVFLVVPQSWATQLLPLTEDALVAQSSLIVIGQCTEVRSAWQGRRLVTLATIAVREVLKGEPTPQVTVMIPGGLDAQRSVPVATVVVGTPQLVPAEEVVVFLSARPDARDTYTLTGWSQGKFSILEDATGRQVVAPDRGILPSPDALRSMSQQNPAGAVSLTQFRAKILHRIARDSSQP